MLTFLIGLFIGSLATISTMSLMMAAKRGDEKLRYCSQDKV
ncbi:DUF3789 domain-containing protein [Bacillus sp. FJAT-27245]|nr:DUF3789 domain-containing protein [Bacillus sp. FJAT-27245]